MATTREAVESAAALTLEIDGDGVAWLVFDRPESKVNILSSDVMRRLDGLLAEVEENADRASQGARRRAETGSFIAGANVEEIAGITDPAEAEEGSRLGQRCSAASSACRSRSIAAIDGICSARRRARPRVHVPDRQRSSRRRSAPGGPPDHPAGEGPRAFPAGRLRTAIEMIVTEDDHAKRALRIGFCG